jgi:fluoride ion exporter CrcB/FEX
MVRIILTLTSSFFSFLGLLGAFTLFSTFLKGARSLERRDGLFGASSFLASGAASA